ncbi:MAG TPA: ParM/StbA family protein [Ktedonobacteraceae bacterium]|jgi:plasmid segregation protein ParM|nr:ParM/StbA family protein [Ktedonobacteraceae bacterium]
MRWYPYGHDFGNAEIGGVTVVNGAMYTLSIPTAFAKVDTNALVNLGIRLDQSDTHIIQFDNEEAAYAVGDLALQQAVDVYHGRGDIQRYSSRYSLRSLLTIAAKLIPDTEFGIYVVTGLPAETYIKNSTLRGAIKAGLDGKYAFTLNGNQTVRKVTVEVATVVMEGAGALIAYGDKASSKTTESAVIDIGGRTTDLYVARGQVPVTEYCKGKPLGVEMATQMMMDAFENKYDRPLSLLEAREIMHAYASQGDTTYPEVSSYGTTISRQELELLVREAVTQVGSEIASFVAAAWRQSDRDAVAASFKPVLNVGGGVYYFYPFLKQRIPHLSRPEDPIHANALGYCSLAGRLLIRRAQASVNNTMLG